MKVEIVHNPTHLDLVIILKYFGRTRPGEKINCYISTPVSYTVYVKCYSSAAKRCQQRTAHTALARPGEELRRHVVRGQVFKSRVSSPTPQDALFFRDDSVAKRGFAFARWELRARARAQACTGNLDKQPENLLFPQLFR